MKKILFFSLALMAGLLALSSCKKDKNAPDMPDSSGGITIGPNDWHAVPQSGCTIELGDISLTVPANTFSKDTKLSVTKLESGSYYGTYEASSFYYITMPPAMNRIITVNMKPNKQVAKVQCAALAPFHRKSTNENVTGGIDLDYYYENGECTIKLPVSDNNNDASDLWIIVGLVEDNSTSSPAGISPRRMTDLTVAPAGQVRNVKWHYAMDTWLWLKRTDSEGTKINNLMTKLTPIITEALTKIHDLGFSLDEERNIPVCFIRDKKNIESYGFFSQSFWNDASSTVELNLEALDKESGDDKVLGKTCIHELLHYFQANYDKRIPQKKAFSGEEDILNEAASVWVEQFMNDGMLDATFVAYYFGDFMRGYYTYDTQNKPAEHGYGMSSMLYYLTSPMSGMDIYGINKNSIVELFQIWKNYPEYRGTSYLTLTKWFSNHQSYFLDYYYKDFLLAALTGKVFDLGVAQKTDISAFDKDCKAYSFNKDRTYTYPTRTCLGLGCAINQGNVSLRTSFAGKEIIIKQEKPDVETYLVITSDDNRNQYYKTAATKDKPLVIKGEELDQMGNGSHITGLYFVTFNPYGKKKDFAVTCTVQDAEEEGGKVPNISAVTIEAELEVGSEADGDYTTHDDYYILRTYDNPTVTKTATGYTVSASEVVSGYTQSLYVEVNTTGASPVVTQMTVHAHNSDYGELSATLTDMPCTSSSSFSQYYSAYEDANTLHVSSFSYDGPYGTFNHMLTGHHSYAELHFYIDL